MIKRNQSIKSNRLLQLGSSIKITVTCLSLLFILTLWGTIAQVQTGLYIAQERFFHSWYFLALGFIPFPGAKLVLSILFVNLVCVAITRFVYKLSHIGILIIHFGLLIYFVSAYVTLNIVKESQVTLMEGDGTNVSTAYHDWEISVWAERSDKKRDVIGYDTRNLKPGVIIALNELGFQLITKSYFPNATAYTSAPENAKEIMLNASGIKYLTKVNLNKEPEKNIPGSVFELQTNDGQDINILVYGGESKPTQFKVDDNKYNIILRRKRFVLPFTIVLKDFEMELHPGTNIARSYKSKVEVEGGGLNREAIIYMNHPLRYKDYTFYQASYAVDQLGRELSTLAVVKNTGQLLPYIACFVTFAGLSTHFLLMAFKSKKKNKK